MIYNIINLILLKGSDGCMKNRFFCVILLIVIMLTGCTQPETVETNDIAAYVGETPITVAEFEFYLDNVKRQMEGTEFSSEEDWQNKEIGGRKAIEVAKERALEIATQNIAYIIIYDKMGKTITDNDQIQIDAIKNGMMNEYSEEGYDKFLEDNNITDEFVDMLCKSAYCSESFYNEIVLQENLSQEESDDAFNKFIEEKMKEYEIVAVETEAIKNIK